MPSNKASIPWTATLTILTATLFITGARAAAQTENVLYSFGTNNHDGQNPRANLIADSAGNLYGTTYQGGAYYGPSYGGTVFEVTPAEGGNWTETVLHSFGHDKDGISPEAGLIFDAAGNLYGTTVYGGADGGGTVFELSSAAGGGWTEKLLHNFNNNGQDGLYPAAGLVFDGSGNLYGTTQQGGSAECKGTVFTGCGTVFELMPRAGGHWTEKILHRFSANGKDGILPTAGLIFDAAGNLYGTTPQGGAFALGTVFELTPSADGGWGEKVLRNFGNYKSGSPSGSLAFDATGNLYGETYNDGTYQDGTVFKLAPTGSGQWTETVVHTFSGSPADGCYPLSGLIFDAVGNLYGTTQECGAYSNSGTAFELSPAAGGSWTEIQLHSFNPLAADGYWPAAGLVFNASGDLYGTTSQGGAGGLGAVFQITP